MAPGTNRQVPSLIIILYYNSSVYTIQLQTIHDLLPLSFVFLLSCFTFYLSSDLRLMLPSTRASQCQQDVMHLYFPIQNILDSVSDGQSKLDAVTQEGQTLYAHLSKQIVSSIQEQVTKANEEFQAFLKQCLKDRQALQDCALALGR